MNWFYQDIDNILLKMEGCKIIFSVYLIRIIKI